MVWLAAVLALVMTVRVGAQEILAGCNAEFPPFEMTDDNNEIIGFDVDIVKAVGKAAGMDVRMHHQSFDTLIPSLDVGRLDVVISGMTITDARLEKVEFSDPYYNAAQVVVVRKGDEADNTMDAIKGKVVGVQLGTTGAVMSEQAMGENNMNLKQYRHYNEAFADLGHGRLDAIVVDLPVAQAYLRKLDGLVISSEPMSEEQYGIAIKKGNLELLGKINQGLKAIRESGEYDRIVDKWFQE
jgi:ABC-type amino acid transport/signal transduction systems, periplasmic component/domain